VAVTGAAVGAGFDPGSGANVRIRLAATSKNSMTSETGSFVDETNVFSLSPESPVVSAFSVSLSSRKQFDWPSELAFKFLKSNKYDR